MGLSPRVRGNLSEKLGITRGTGSIPACAGEPGSPFRFGDPLSRSIPACAGEPDLSISVGSKCMVYPRVCGGT